MDCAICSLFQFSYLHAFYKPNNITTELNHKLNLISKVSLTKRQMNIPLWTHMEHKEWRKDGKNFTRCYTIALKIWNEFNVNFVLLYFSSYKSIKWHFYFKNVKKISSLIFTKIFSRLRNILRRYLKKIVLVVFCVFQTNLNKAANIFHTPSE